MQTAKVVPIQIKHKPLTEESGRNHTTIPYEPIIYNSHPWSDEVERFTSDEELHTWWQEKKDTFTLTRSAHGTLLLVNSDADGKKVEYALPEKWTPIFQWAKLCDLNDLWRSEAPQLRFTLAHALDYRKLNHDWITEIEGFSDDVELNMWWQQKCSKITLRRNMYNQIIMDEQYQDIEEKRSYNLPSSWALLFSWTNSTNINSAWQKVAPHLSLTLEKENNQEQEQQEEETQQNILFSRRNILSPTAKVKEQVNMNDVNVYLDNMFAEDEKLSLSASLDILAIYLKFEKTLYTEAKVYCEQQLNYLMLPAIMISAFCSVLSQALQYQVYGAIIISSLTAFNSFLLSLISYLKLDAKAEAHKSSAYQYEKLQALAEFNSGKVMYFNVDDRYKDQHVINVKPQDNKTMREVVYNLVDNIEKKVEEIKEMNKFILPEVVRSRFIYIYNRNIFSAVKEIQNYEFALRIEFQNSLNDIIEEKKSVQKTDLSLRKLRSERDRILQEIIKLRQKYNKDNQDIDARIEKDMEKRSKSWFNCFRWLKT